MTSVQRTPFAEIGASRLQGLTSKKNCQNAITDMLANGHNESTKKLSSPAQNKRPLATNYDDHSDEDFDSENIDPAELFSSKRSKGLDGTPSKRNQPRFNLNISPRENVFKTPSTNKATTPTSPIFTKSSSTPSAFMLPSGTSSAPAGRSPKHKRIGLLSKKRNSLSPYKRVEPPSARSGKSSGGLPFSIDAALSGTLSKAKEPIASPSPASTSTAMPMPTTNVAASVASTIEESMPKSWFFDIHEDTLEEEAANIMEHSTGILDISSDDEAGPSKKDERGKENIPPTDHATNVVADDVQPTGKKARRPVDPDAMKDIGEERSPLGALPAEDFYASGLDAKSIEIIKAEQDEEKSEPSCKENIDNGAASPPVAPNSPHENQEQPQDTSLETVPTITDTKPNDDQPSFEIAIDQENQ